MNKIVKAAIGIVVVGAVGAIVFTRINKPEEVIEAVPNPTVRVEAPQAGTITLFTDLTGTVEPSDVVDVINKGSGEVLEVYVSQGDMVQKDQALYKIDNKSLEAAKITMDTARVSLNDAQTNLNRMKVLYESGDISAQNYESVVNSVELARLQYESAKLNYDIQEENTVVLAPIGGLLESFDVEVHDMMSAGAAAAVISGEGSKSISFYVSERVQKGLALGDPIDVEKNGLDYIGYITEIGSMVDSSTGLFKVKASLNEADALATGTKVKLFVTSDKAENVMTVPVDCVDYSNGNAYVYTYDGGTAHQIFFEDGLIDSEKVEVKSGLSYDDQVIVSWSKELYDGAPVNLQTTEAAGTDKAETEAAGADGAGADAAGAEAAGADEAGTESAGADEAGAEAAETDEAGAETDAGNTDTAAETEAAEETAANQ